MTRPWLLLCSIFLLGNTHVPLGVVSACSKPGYATLTFDDGITGSSSRILDILDKEQVKAAFFIIGETITPKTFPILQRTYKAGHTVGNHTWSHPSLTHLSEAKLNNEVLTTQNGFLPLAPIPFKRYIRPPYGAINSDVYRMLSREGFTVVLWNMDIKDWKAYRSRDQLWSSFKRQIDITNPTKNSLIILLHTKEKTADLLPDIITTLRAKNFQIVSLEKCLSPT